MRSLVRVGYCSFLVAIGGVVLVGNDAARAEAPVEYVKVCELYGKGFFYIPGTETCLKLTGGVRTEGRYEFQAAPFGTARPATPSESYQCGAVGMRYLPGSNLCIDLGPNARYTTAAIPNANTRPLTYATNFGFLTGKPTLTASVDFGFSSTRYDTNYSTDLPSHASTSLSESQTSLGVDGRIAVPLNERVALTGGVWARTFFGGETTTRVDLDAFSPGPDTTFNVRRTGFLLPYLGVSAAFPTISSWNAGTAWQPGSGKFIATLFAGPRFDFLEGAVTTDELGLIRTSTFNRTVTGLTVGVDVDYPLWLSGFDSRYNSVFNPVIRAGIAADFGGDYSVGHIANFADYRLDGSTKTSVRAFVGFGFQVAPP